MTLKLMAATVIVASGLAWLNSATTTLNPASFADQIPGVDQVNTMTWTDTHFIRVTSKDGTKTWIEQERRLHAYRHPGQYRETFLNQDGQPTAVHITDARAGRMLQIDLKNRQAVLKTPLIDHDHRGPFAWVGDEIRQKRQGNAPHVKALSLQGQTQLDDRQANVVRAITRDSVRGSESRHDFLFDPISKQLIGIWAPNEAGLELATVSGDTQAMGSDWSRKEPVAVLMHEMNLDPQLSAADFSLDPPGDFALERQAAPTVTEEEMVAYLGAAARFNHNTFPDSPYETFDADRLNAEWEKDASARSAEASQLIEAINRIRMRDIYQPPVKRFADDHTMTDSFHYVGSGVKVGQADRIVCWYRLRSTNKYRGVYGDLSIKDVAETELPLKLSR